MGSWLQKISSSPSDTPGEVLARNENIRSRPPGWPRNNPGEAGVPAKNWRGTKFSFPPTTFADTSTRRCQTPGEEMARKEIFVPAHGFAECLPPTIPAKQNLFARQKFPFSRQVFAGCGTRRNGGTKPARRAPLPGATWSSVSPGKTLHRVFCVVFADVLIFAEIFFCT